MSRRARKGLLFPLSSPSSHQSRAHTQTLRSAMVVVYTAQQARIRKQRIPLSFLFGWDDVSLSLSLVFSVGDKGILSFFLPVIPLYSSFLGMRRSKSRKRDVPCLEYSYSKASICRFVVQYTVVIVGDSLREIVFHASAMRSASLQYAKYVPTTVHTNKNNNNTAFDSHTRIASDIQRMCANVSLFFLAWQILSLDIRHSSGRKRSKRKRN